MKPLFIHLRAHSEYSLRDGLLHIKPWLKAAAEMKMPGIGLTDFHNLFALIKFYQQALNLGIKPLIGTDVHLKCEDACFPATLFCQNQQGYQHLTSLISKSYLDGQTAGVSRSFIGTGWRKLIKVLLCYQVVCRAMWVKL